MSVINNFIGGLATNCLCQAETLGSNLSIVHLLDVRTSQMAVRGLLAVAVVVLIQQFNEVRGEF